MRLKNKMAIVVSLVSIFCICWSAVVAQQSYPSTGRNAFAPSNNAFPVSSPTQLDQLTGADSEMSPDHWGSTANLEGDDTYLSANTAKPWDGEIESHPWLKQDEMEGFDPSNFPELNTKSFSVSAQPETQSEIPLPPSASSSDGVPLPPSSTKSPSQNSESHGYPKSTGSDQPPLGTNRSINSEPPVTNGSSLIREPGFNSEPANSRPVFSNDNAVELNPPVVGNSSSRPASDGEQPLDPPPLPALPSSKIANDFVPRAANPRTIDYPDGEYRADIESPPVAESSGKDPGPASVFGRAGVTNANDVGPAVTDSVVLSPSEKVDNRRDGFLRRDGRMFGRTNREEGNYGSPAMSGQPVTAMPQRYPFANLVGNSQQTQEKIQSQAVPTPTGASSPVGTAGCGCDNPAAPTNARPKFRPDLGFRSEDQVIRGMVPEDNGQQFGYEEEHYPSMREILKTGRYFGSVEALLLKPSFQGNTSIAQSDGLTQAFDFDWAFAPKLRLGFESQFGPGGELIYSQYDQNSDPAVFTSDGVVSGTTSVYLPGQNTWSQLTASNAGETLVSDQSLEIQQFSACMFKDLNFRRAKLNGIFGLQYVGIHQELSSYLLDSGGATIGQLSNRSDKHFLGPRVGFEYYRKIGHTGLTLVNNFGGSLLFGNADQYVDNGGVNVSAISGADELLTILDIGFGIQKHKRIGETRSVYWKIGYDFQSWLGGGNAAAPDSDFGIRGYSFAIGFNR